MGLVGPAGLMNVQVSTGTIPMNNFEQNAPQLKFESFSRAMGLRIPMWSEEHHGTFEKIDGFEKGEARAKLLDLAAAAMPSFKSIAVADADLIALGTDALAAAEAEIDGDVGEFHEKAIGGWFTSAGLFKNVGGDPNLSLIAMFAVGREPVNAGSVEAGLSPAIAQQLSAQSLLKGPRTIYTDVMKGHEGGYIRLWGSIDEMLDALELGHNIMIMDDVHDKDYQGLWIRDDEQFRFAMDDLVRNSVFNPSAEVRDAARWIIWEGSQKLGAKSASIHDFYMARGVEKWDGFTVPAINVRGLTYDMARLIFKQLKEIDAGAAIFEIAKSEIGYTDQRPAEYAATVLAAAVREGWRGPVFLQGDHFQAGKREDVDSIKELIKEAIEAGFYNIDIDASKLVDYDLPTEDEQQKDNYEITAELTKYIREIEPEGITVSVGGEIGEIIGDKGRNSTAADLRAFMDGYLEALGPEDVGLSKISIQTGTSHGGVPLRDGSIADAKIDFDVIEKLGRIAREEYGIGGVVQHGASTLPDEAFHHFRERGATEVHLATGFQNVIYDSEAFPSWLRDRVYESVRPEADAALKKAADKGEDVTEVQAYYKTRKKGFKPFKREMWSLPLELRADIMTELAAKFGMLFGELGVAGTRELIDAFVTPVEIQKPFGNEAKEAVIEDDGDPNAD